MNNFEGAIAQALAYALEKASEPGETLPLRRLSRRLAPSVANAVECMMPFAMEKLEGPITGAMLVERNSMRQEIEASVIAAIREMAYEPPPPLPPATRTNAEGWDSWVRTFNLDPGVWDWWVSADSDFYDLEATFRVTHKGGGPSRTPRRMRLGRSGWMRCAPGLWDRLWRRITRRTIHQEL